MKQPIVRLLGSFLFQPVAVLIAAVLAWSVVAAAQAEDLRRFSKSERHMAVEFEIVLYAESENSAAEAFRAAFERIEALNRVMSDYDADSELSRLSAGAPHSEPVPVSEELFTVLQKSQEISRLSGGAFDVTVGPLTKLWRRARRQKELPSDAMIARARAASGDQFMKLDPKKKTVQLTQPEMRLDLGGIAKGYAADEALAVVRELGINRALVRASGDIVVGDPPPGEEGWKVGIAPLEPEDPPRRFVRLANAAISTSGDSRQHLVLEGRRYSHLIDPRSGAPVEGRSSVSVVAPKGILSDALASALSVLGPEKGRELIEKVHGTAALIVWQTGDQPPKTVQSPTFKRWEISP
jgi:thiamine biosynthesis lipoprotein